MNCSSRYEDTIPSLRHETHQLAWHGFVSDGLPQALRAAVGFQASVDPGLGPFRKDYPGLVFSGVARRYKFLVGIRRMHLNREPLCHIKELQKQGETPEMSGQLTEQPLRRLLQ